MSSIYEKTLKDGSLGPNAPTVGSKIAYVCATILETLEDEGVDTDPSAAQSLINRLVELGCDPNSTAIRAMKFDLNEVIQRQRQ